MIRYFKDYNSESALKNSAFGSNPVFPFYLEEGDVFRC